LADAHHGRARPLAAVYGPFHRGRACGPQSWPGPLSPSCSTAPGRPAGPVPSPP